MASGRPGTFGRFGHESGSQAGPSSRGGDDRVEQEGVEFAVPRDVDEARQASLLVALAVTQPRLCACNLRTMSSSSEAEPQAPSKSECNSPWSIGPRHCAQGC